MDEIDLLRRWLKQCGHYSAMELVDRWRNMRPDVRARLLSKWLLEDAKRREKGMLL